MIHAFQEHRRSQVGFSILDTRPLRSWRRNQGTNLETLIKTSNVCTGSDTQNIEALRFFRFGITETISAYDITTKIRAVINQFDEAGQARRIILAGHGLGEDL